MEADETFLRLPEGKMVETVNLIWYTEENIMDNWGLMQLCPIRGNK